MSVYQGYDESMSLLLVLYAVMSAGAGELQTALDEMRSIQDVPGISAAVVRDGEIVFAGGSGFADLETGLPMTADTVIYMGSLSKVLTAMLVLSLVEDKRVALHEPVTAISKAPITTGSPVRVVPLLTHTSGLAREGDFDYWFTADFPDSTALLSYLQDAPLRFTPGQGFHYSNVGYAALGMVIETASGKPYRDLLRSRVLGPLEMKNSGMEASGENVANGYTPRGLILPSQDRPFAGVGEKVADRHIRMYHHARSMTPAFGVYTTTLDLCQLALSLLGFGTSVISESLSERMWEPQAGGWGLGLKIQQHQGGMLARQDGWFAAHRSHLLLDPAQGIAVAVQANSDNASPGKIAEVLHALVMKGT